VLLPVIFSLGLILSIINFDFPAFKANEQLLRVGLVLFGYFTVCTLSFLAVFLISNAGKVYSVLVKGRDNIEV